MLRLALEAWRSSLRLRKLIIWLKTVAGTTSSRDDAAPAPTALDTAAGTSLEDISLAADAGTAKHFTNKKIETL
jgi:hypothetical protein